MQRLTHFFRSHVIKELMRWAEEDTGRPKVAYFFCDFRNSESQDLAGFLGSIICHTLPKTGNIPTNIAKTFHISTAGGTFRKPELPFLLGVLKTLASKGINFLIASRESDDIRKSLEAFHHIRIEDQVALVDEDITNYISYRLEIDPDLHWLGSNLRTVKAVRQSLHQLPHDLYESYERILERVVDSDWSALRRILLWVLFAVRPLTLEELHTAVAIDLSLDFLDEESLLRHPREILTLGSGLLSVTEKGHVSLVHLSIKSYLTSTKIQQSKTTSFFALSSDESTTLLFRLCMKYISYGDFSKGPCRSAQEYIDRLQKYPFLNHAARTWPYYYRRSTPSEILHDTAINFFSEENRGVFMSWVQAINADTPFSWHFYPHHATSLYYAATFGLTHIVRHLVDIGVDLNAPGSRYWGTALHGAVYRMHTPIVKLLLEAGADVNKADYLQVTPLHTAATLGDIELIRLLLHFSANTGATDGMGESPIDWASKCGQMSTRDLLLGEDCASDSTIPYFPDFHGLRSGLESSIILRVEVGGQILTEEDNPTDISL
ncbi:ankyrin [Ustulina deusta]|nr:ankyrin [Ustulina deusta]